MLFGLKHHSESPALQSLTHNEAKNIVPCAKIYLISLYGEQM